jgi:hypothetical protein
MLLRLQKQRNRFAAVVMGRRSVLVVEQRAVAACNVL